MNVSYSCVNEFLLILLHRVKKKSQRSFYLWWNLTKKKWSWTQDCDLIVKRISNNPEIGHCVSDTTIIVDVEIVHCMDR